MQGAQSAPCQFTAAWHEELEDFDLVQGAGQMLASAGELLLCPEARSPWLFLRVAASGRTRDHPWEPPYTLKSFIST